jgi:hypothetical protein
MRTRTRNNLLHWLGVFALLMCYALASIIETQPPL